MVVADGGGEEVGGEALGLQYDLGAAQAAFVAVARQLGFGDEGCGEIGGEFEDGGGAAGQLAVHGHTETRLEVRVIYPVSDHRQGDGAMREEQPVAVDG